MLPNTVFDSDSLCRVLGGGDHDGDEHTTARDGDGVYGCVRFVNETKEGIPLEYKYNTILRRWVSCTPIVPSTPAS